MKTTYSTITLRYLHDVVTGEFANIGVVLYSPDQRYLEARFTASYDRLNAIFLKIDHLHYRALIRYMANRFEEIAKPFKTRLGRRAEKLSEKKIETKDYQYDFRYAWKNDIWHLYEPVSFDLVDPNSIREKANKWLGRGVALNDARKKEEFKIHFLLGEPRQDDTKRAFQNAIHLLSKIPAQKELVRENELEKFAEHIAEEIGSHEASEMVLRDKPKRQ